MRRSSPMPSGMLSDTATFRGSALADASDSVYRNRISTGVVFGYRTKTIVAASFDIERRSIYSLDHVIWYSFKYLSP